jgi:hypothetical protein
LTSMLPVLVEEMARFKEQGTSEAGAR